MPFIPRSCGRISMPPALKAEIHLRTNAKGDLLTFDFTGGETQGTNRRLNR